MTVLTDYPELISPGQVIYAGEKYKAYTIKDIRWHGGDMLVSLKELPDRTAVEIFRNIMVYMRSEDMPELPEGEYFIHQLDDSYTHGYTNTFTRYKTRINDSSSYTRSSDNLLTLHNHFQECKTG